MLELSIEDAAGLANSNALELEPKDHARAIRVAELRAKELGPEELKRAREEAETMARKEIDKVMEGCNIIGRAIAWFRSPKPGRK